jgi:hypothetical protein
MRIAFGIGTVENVKETLNMLAEEEEERQQWTIRLNKLNKKSVDKTGPQCDSADDIEVASFRIAQIDKQTQAQVGEQ